MKLTVSSVLRVHKVHISTIYRLHSIKPQFGILNSEQRLSLSNNSDYNIWWRILINQKKSWPVEWYCQVLLHGFSKNPSWWSQRHFKMFSTWKSLVNHTDQRVTQTSSCNSDIIMTYHWCVDVFFSCGTVFFCLNFKVKKMLQVEIHMSNFTKMSALEKRTKICSTTFQTNGAKIHLKVQCFAL